MIDEEIESVSYSLPVDHGLPRHDGTSCEGIRLSHPPTISHEMKHHDDENAWHRTNVVLLTSCLGATWDCLALMTENNAPAHSLLDQMCETQLGKVCNNFTSYFFTFML